MLPMKENQKVWKNWSGMVSSTPKYVMYPGSVEDVVSLVKQCAVKGRAIRVIGSGHSFTPLVQTKDVLLSLDHLSGVEKVDAQSRTVEVWAGTKLKDLSNALYKQG